MFVRFNNTVGTACGVGVVGNFLTTNSYAIDTPIKSVIPKGGCGWVLASFTPQFKEAYEELCERWGAPVYQSPVRKNKNSGNKFFFAIWDTTVKSGKVKS